MKAIDNPSYLLTHPPFCNDYLCNSCNFLLIVRMNCLWRVVFSPARFIQHV